MKKLLTLTLALLMAVGMFAACSKEPSGPVVKVIEINLTEEEYAFGVDKNQPELLASVNEIIAEIMADGTFDTICNNYFGDGTPVAVASAALDESKDQLVVATNAAFEPFEYTSGDSYYGIDMEIAKVIADKLGKELVIANMDFDAVCLSVGQQKADIAMAGLTVRPDREEYVAFTDSYYNAAQKLIVKADWRLDGFPVTCTGYKNGSLAVQDLINGNIQYVVIDSAPAACITAAYNDMN